MRLLRYAFVGAGLVVLSATAYAAPILDGSGFGAPSAVVTFDAGAPVSNFSTPGTTTSGAPYDIYVKADATYAYVLVKTTGGGAAGTFANLYFGTGSSAATGSDVGFEVTNSDVFAPGISAPIASIGPSFAVLDGGNTIEFAVPFSYFETDPQSIGFTPTTAAHPDILLRLSQSFGYSVAGGIGNYGPNDLGLIVDPIGAVPEPASFVLLGSALLGMGTIGWRRRRS